MADWSLLPKDLLQLISGNLETCFEIVQFRSVCVLWRSAVPSSSYRRGLGCKSLLPIFYHHLKFGGDEHCILQKIPIFLFRFQTPFGDDYSIVRIREGNSGKQTIISPITRFDDTSKDEDVIFNTFSTQIIPLGHYYQIEFYATVERWNRTRRWSFNERVAFLPHGKDFIMIAGVLDDLMVYRSSEKSWSVVNGSFRSCRDIVSFKDKIYIVDRSGRGHVFVIEPSLVITEIEKVTLHSVTYWERLVVSKDELLLVQRFTPGEYGEEHMHTWFRVFKLKEKCWVRIDDLEDRVVVFGDDWNLCYPAKELPGTKGNCILFKESTTPYMRIFVFDLKTRKTSDAFTECRGYMGAFGKNREALVSSGILTIPYPVDVFYCSLARFSEPRTIQRILSSGRFNREIAKAKEAAPCISAPQAEPNQGTYTLARRKSI